LPVMDDDTRAGREGQRAPRTRGMTSGGRPGWARWWPAGVAWALFALVLLEFATYPWLDRLMRQAGRPELGLLIPFSVALTLAALTASTVGVVLASRRPRHPVGWLLLALGLVCQRDCQPHYRPQQTAQNALGPSPTSTALVGASSRPPVMASGRS